MIIFLLLLVTAVGAVTDCGVTTDPFFQTVSYNSKFDMWHAFALVSEFDANGNRLYTTTMQHWETRSISNKCIITRTVYIPDDNSINIYQQKIHPEVGGVYLLQEYVPQQGRFVDISDCQVRKIDAWTVNVMSIWSLYRQLRVIEPHRVYHETVRTNLTETASTVTAIPPSHQSDFLKNARAAFEQGKVTEAISDPLPSFVYREK